MSWQVYFHLLYSQIFSCSPFPFPSTLTPTPMSASPIPWTWIYPWGLFLYRFILCCHSQILFWKLLCPLTWPLTICTRSPGLSQSRSQPDRPSVPGFVTSQQCPSWKLVRTMSITVEECRREKRNERWDKWVGGKGKKSSFLHLATLFWWSPKNQTASPDCVLRRKGDGRREMTSIEYLLCACTMREVLRSV